MEPAVTTRVHTRAFMEHRWGQRVPLGLPVHLEAENRISGAGRLRDASISGGFIATDVGLPLLANLNVFVLIGDGAARRAVALAGCVTRVDPAGFAVEWRDMASPALLALLRGCGAGFAHLTSRDRVFS